jgi:hypothetical protein
MKSTARIQASFSPPRVLLETTIDINGISQIKTIINNTIRNEVEWSIGLFFELFDHNINPNQI